MIDSAAGTAPPEGFGTANSPEAIILSQAWWPKEMPARTYNVKQSHHSKRKGHGPGPFLFQTLARSLRLHRTWSQLESWASKPVQLLEIHIFGCASSQKYQEVNDFCFSLLKRKNFTTYQLQAISRKKWPKKDQINFKHNKFIVLMYIVSQMRWALLCSSQKLTNH